MAKLKDGFYKLTAEAVGSDSYMLLAGGGSKALSDFATASGVVTALGTNGNYVTWTKNGTVNNLTVPYSTNADTVDNKHASDFIQTSVQMISGKGGKLTGYHQENGWHRIATIDASSSYGYGSHILYLTGTYNYAQNTNAIIHINTMSTTGKITQVSGYVGFANKIRLVNVSSNKFYVDVHINYTDKTSSSSDTPGTVYYYFLGNGSVTINALVEKITDTVTAASEVTLVNTEGNVLTSGNYTNWINTTNFPGLNKVGTVTSVTVTGANGLSGSGTVTSSGTITLSNSGVRSTTINGNYLRVNTNGTNNDLTIPYATNADTLDGYHITDIITSGYVTSSTANLSSYWGKLWEMDGIVADNKDITLYVHSAYQDFRGFVHINVRRNSSTADDGTVTYNWSIKLKQISGNLPKNRFRLYYNNVSGLNNSGKVLLWCDVNSRWGVYNCQLISATPRVGKESLDNYGTLYSTSFTTVQTLPVDPYIELTDVNPITDYYWANVKISSSSSTSTTPTFKTATATTSVTTPLVSSTGRLTLNATSTSVDLKFNNDNTKSVILNGSAFKPFDDANNKLTLGSSSARWSELYSVKGNFIGLVRINGAAADKPLVVRGIVGQDGANGTAAELYLQYGANKSIMLGNTGAHSISADGSLYTGNAASATNADKVDGIHASELLTSLVNTNTTANPKSISITVGGTTKHLKINHAVNSQVLQSVRYDDSDPTPNTTVGATFQFSDLSDIGWHNVLTLKSYTDNNYTAAQLATPAGNPGKDSDYSGTMRWRQGRNSTWLSWKTILDSSNYTSYVNTTNFPGLNKVGTVTSVTVTGANGLSGSGTVTASGTITLSNAGVRSTTINGNYLRVNTNGTNADLTIPYSTNAGSANTLNKQQLPGTTTNAADTVWCKFATLTFNDGAYSPVSGYLFFSARESTDFIGILHYHFRANSDKTVLGGASLRWLVNTNLSIQVISVKTANNVYDLYVNNYNTWSTPVIHNMLTEGSFVWNVGYWTSKPTAAHTSTQSGIVNYANSAATAGLASNVTVSNSDENKTLKLVFHDGNALKSTGGIYCNPSTDTLYSTKVIATNFTSNVATGTQPYACTSTTVNTNLNADMLDGFHLNSSTRNNEANKVVRTDGSGYTNFGWINTTSGNFTGTPDRIYASNDGYIRYMTPDNFRANVIGNNYWKVNDQTTAGTDDIYLEMWRGVNASWKILNAGGVLKFLNNYTSSAGSYFDCLTVDYNTGNTWIKGNLTNVSTTQSNRFYLRNNGTTGIYADLKISTRGTKCTTAGTAGTTGVTYLFLGNNTAVSTTIDLGAENAQGILRLYGTNTGYVNIRCGTHTTESYNLYLPGATGLFVYHTNDTAIGSSTKPVYIASTGAATECSTYAGGTAVTLNGTSKAATTASFYAPTAAGTSNYVLKSNGSGAPTWISQSDLSVGNATNWSRCITWESPTTVNTWSKVLKIKKYSNVLLTINFSQSSQASQHLYLISTGHDCARIVLLGANKYSAHFDIQVRVTQASSTEHHVEVYNTYGYNNATTVNFDCRALNMGTSTELEGYTTYTAGSGTVKDSLISHHTISRNLAIDRLECIEILSTSTYNTVAKVKTRLEDIWNTVGRSVGSYVVVSSTAIDNWSTNTATVSSSSSYAMIKIGGAYEGNDYGLWLLSTYGDNKIGYVGRSGDTWTNIKWLATTDLLDPLYTSNIIMGTSSNNFGQFSYTGSDLSRHTNLTLGNNIAYNTSGKAWGSLKIYGRGTGATTIRRDNATTGDHINTSYSLYLPKATGEIVHHPLGTKIGSETHPVYINENGLAVACNNPVLKTVENTCTITYNLENCLFYILKYSSYLMHISIRDDNFSGSCTCLLTYDYSTYNITVLSKVGFTSFNSFKINTKREGGSSNNLTLSFWLTGDSNPNHGSSIQMYVRLIELGEVRNNITISSSHNGSVWEIGGTIGTSFIIHNV